MHVTDLDWEGEGGLTVTQRIERGFVRLKALLPLVISVRKELNKPRYIPFTGILAAESKEIRRLAMSDLDVDPARIGLDGSPTKMAGVEVRRFERAKERLEGSVDDIVQRLVERIYQLGVI
jgi:electron transfer flavoprotein beta subunit